MFDNANQCLITKTWNKCTFTHSIHSDRDNSIKNQRTGEAQACVCSL